MINPLTWLYIWTEHLSNIECASKKRNLKNASGLVDALQTHGRVLVIAESYISVRFLKSNVSARCILPSECRLPTAYFVLEPSIWSVSTVLVGATVCTIRRASKLEGAIRYTSAHALGHQRLTYLARKEIVYTIHTAISHGNQDDYIPDRRTSTHGETKENVDKVEAECRELRLWCSVLRATRVSVWKPTVVNSRIATML